jgi:hypothetical protein
MSKAITEPGSLLLAMRLVALKDPVEVEEEEGAEGLMDVLP